MEEQENMSSRKIKNTSRRIKRIWGLRRWRNKLRRGSEVGGVTL
jgi:hypothetical protein